MNKVYLFVLVLLSASFTGCLDFGELPVEEEETDTEDSSDIENESKYSTISRATEYETLKDCLNGGVIIKYGIDENGNGTLDDDEVDGDVVVCHGEDGQDGEDGADGQDGKDGKDGDGGQDGDDGADGEDGEDGEDGGTGGLSNDTLLTIITIPAEALGCNGGGRVISYGLDNGDGNDGISANGKLEEGEIDASIILCTKKSVGLMRDINIGSGSSNMYDFTEFKGNVFFSLIDSVYGRELWIAEIGTGSVRMFKDIRPGSYGSSPQNFAIMGDMLYFSADDGTHGTELWKTDGTEEGTMMVEDIRPEGSYGSSPNSITAVGDTLYFEAYTDDFGVELWKWNFSDGAGIVKDIFPGNNSFGNPNGSYPSGFMEFNNLVYFNARDSWDEGGSGNYELWKTDGTEEGTVLVKDINSVGTSSYVSYLTPFGDMLYFRANDGNSENGTELWKTDGTENGTVLVKDIRSGSYGSDPSYLTVFGNTQFIYFTANDGINGTELWRSDGTEDGTVMVKNIYEDSSGSGPTLFTVVGSTLYFKANDGTNGSELWKTDGSTSGTVMVKDIYPGSGGSNPYDLIVVGDGFGGEVLYFSASDGSFGYELWKSDGTEAGTTMVKDIKYGSDSGLEYSDMYAIGDILLFTADDGFTGHELYWNAFPETSIFYE